MRSQGQPGCRPTKKRSAVEAQSKMPLAQHHHPLLAWLLQVNESVKSEAGQSDDLDFPRALPGSRHDLKFAFLKLQACISQDADSYRAAVNFATCPCAEIVLKACFSGSRRHLACISKVFWAISWWLTNFYDVNLAGHGLDTFMKSYEALT